MVPASLMARLNRSNRTVRTDRGQTGDTDVHEHQAGGNTPPGRVVGSETCGTNSAGREYGRPSWPVS